MANKASYAEVASRRPRRTSRPAPAAPGSSRPAAPPQPPPSPPRGPPRRPASGTPPSPLRGSPRRPGSGTPPSALRGSPRRPASGPPPPAAAAFVSVAQGSRFTISASNTSLNKPATAAAAGSMKIANEVIEEVDEQATITSMVNRRPENRPTAMSLFSQGPPTPSVPVDVPSRNSNHSNMRSDTRLSSSAPNQWTRSLAGDDKSPGDASLSTQLSFNLAPEERPRLDSDVGPSLSAAGSQTLLDEVDCGDDQEDDFNRLRSIREQHRRTKYLQKLMARSVSAQQQTGSGELVIDNDLLLEELLMQSDAAKNEESKNKSKDDST